MNPFLSLLGGGGGGVSASSSAKSGDATSGAGDFMNNAAFSVTGSGRSNQTQESSAGGGLSQKTVIIGVAILAGIYLITSLVGSAKS